MFMHILKKLNQILANISDEADKPYNDDFKDVKNFDLLTYGMD